MAFLGGISGIWAHKFIPENDWRNPMQSTAYSSIEPSVAAAAPHDKYAWKYLNLTGGAWINTWRSAVAEGKVWYCWHMNHTLKDGTADLFHFFYAHYDPASWGGGPVTGAIAVRMNEGGGGELEVLQYNGVIWAQVGITAGFDYSANMNTDYYITLELDRSGGTGNHEVSLWIGDSSGMMDGGGTDKEYIEDASPGVDIVLTGTPCIYNKEETGGKGAGETNDVTVQEVFTYDDASPGMGDGLSLPIEYYGAASCPHVLSIMPVGDSEVAGEDEWSITGNPASCPTHAWRAVDDYFDDDDQESDRIHSTGDSSDIDQLFDLAEDWHDPGETPTVYGVAAVLSSRELGQHREVDKGLMYCTDEAGPVEYAVVTAGNTMGAQPFTPVHQTPAGNPWTHNKLDVLRAGVRNNSASKAERCNILLVHVLGTYLQQPSNNLACPGITHIRQGVALGSANTMIY